MDSPPVLTIDELFTARMAVAERLRAIFRDRHAGMPATRDVRRAWIRELVRALRALNALSRHLYGVPK